MRVIFSADYPPEDLFNAAAPSEYDKHHARVLIGDLHIKSVCLSLLLFEKTKQILFIVNSDVAVS